MKISLKAKSIIKKVALALAGIAALTAVGFGVKAIVDYTKKDLKTISPTFEIGNLGSDGKYVNDESTLYTKDAFRCDGLQIKLDFDNQINYQIFYYDDLDNFTESTDVLSEAYSDGGHDSYARLVIIPTNDEDDKISWTEKFTYPQQLTIKVNKNQNNDYVNILNKRLRVVEHISDLRFVYGDIISANGSFQFAANGMTSCTSKDVLAVKGGYKLTLYSSAMTIPSGASAKLEVFEFRENNGLFDLVKQSKEFSSITFDERTTHIIMKYSLWSDSTSSFVEMSESDLLDINKCLTISKN